jgi:nephrocystin-3
MRRSSPSRTARIFLSSTFKDFGEERNLLVKKVFPSLRERLKDRFVELVDVDLRWGIPQEKSERGEVLPICLAEIDRSRPFFVGLLGERYGYVPPPDKYLPHVLESQPWLKKHQGGKSVTELEILHGVLNNPKMAGRALFYFRSAAYAKQKGGDYLPQSTEDWGRQKDLKARIRKSGFPVVQGYQDPEALAKRLEKDLWKILDEMYPADEVPDAFTRERFRHEAYALPRRRLYLGGEAYIDALDAAFAEGKQRVLVEGASGGGKSALIANWLEKRGKKHRTELVHVHYLRATAEASDPQALVRRLAEAIKRLTESTEEIPSDPQALYDSLSTWLAIAHAYAAKRRTKVLIVLDALNGLRDLQDLRWFPEFLPERVRMVVSCLPGQVHEALLTKGDWQRVEVTPLDGQQAEDLFVAYLRRYNKELPKDLLTPALDHPLSTNPLFLRTLAEELRLFGVHEQLKDRLGHYLTSKTVDDLFERVLERVEHDCGAKQVRKAMEGIWASRAGLSEHEIQGFASLKPAEWAPIRHALDDSLLESGGRITFAHDYMRLAVSDRYLAGNNTLQDDGQSPEALKLRRKAHVALAKWFDTRPEEEKSAKGANGRKVKPRRKTAAPASRPADARSAEEVPWQYQQAKDWKSLKASLTRRDMFETVHASRTNEELLSYWLDIEAQARARIEKEYEKAWKTWEPKKTEEATGDLASNLSSILTEAGRYLSSFVEEISRLALDIEKKIYGTNSLQVSARLLRLGGIMWQKGDYASAEPLLRRALAISEKRKGLEHPETGHCLNNLAGLLQDKGDLETAELLYRRALAITEKVQGKQHPATSRALNNLAYLYHVKGQYQVAETLYRRALIIAEKSRGKESTLTATCLSNLAFLLIDKGNYESAEPLCRRALAIRERVQGFSHPDTGDVLNNLASLLHERGNLDVAEPLYRRALAIAEKAQGAEHPSTGASLNNLAVLLRDKGDYAAAEPLYRRALAIAEKAQGADHPETGRSLNNLALLLKDKGDYDVAEPLYRRALAIAEKAQGADHPETGTRLNNLAVLLKDKGDYAAAEPLYRRALAIAEKAQGAEHPSTGASLNNLAVLLRDKGDYAAAEPLYRRALAIAEKAQGAEHPETGRSLNNLARLLEDKGDYDAAEPLLRRALVIAEKSLPPDHPQLTGSLYRLGNFLIDRDHSSEGVALLRRELGILEGREGSVSSSVAQSLYNLGCRLAAVARFEEAEPLLKKEISIIEELEGEQSASVGQSLYNLGNLFADLGRFEEAEPLLRRALSIEEANLGPNHEDVMGSLANLGDVLRRAGEYVDAETELARAVDLARKLGFGGPFSQMAELRIDQKRYEDAVDLLQRCLEIRRRKLDPADEAIGEAIQKLVEVYRLMGQDAQAEEILKQLPADGSGHP